MPFAIPKEIKLHIKLQKPHTKQRKNTKGTKNISDFMHSYIEILNYFIGIKLIEGQFDEIVNKLKKTM